MTPRTLANGLVGQERLLAQLDDAATRPLHAYLVAGSDPDAVVAAARALAGRLIGADERGWRLLEAAVHPDVREFEPQGLVYKVEDIRKEIVAAAMRAPVESDCLVIIVHESERLCSVSNKGAGANAFLKTLEEPAPRTVIILVTTAVDELLPTIRSRCARIDVAPVTSEQIRASLAAESFGADPPVTPDDIARAVALGGGQLARSRRLVTDLRELRHAFASAPSRLDGTGATVARLAAELDGAVTAAAAEAEVERHAELAEFDARMKDEGYDARVARSMRKAVTDRHKRMERKARIDLMLEGVAAIESVLFDALSGADWRNDDVPALDWSPRRCATAIDACRATRAALAINEKGTLHLEHLLLTLSRQ